MNEKRMFGLVGHPLTHSFSKKYFSEKFERSGLSGTHEYELFDLEDINQLPELFKNNSKLEGVNVTIPYKQAVFPFLTYLDSSAEKVGAVNVIKKNSDGTFTGYNSDYYGFKKSLLEFLGERPASDLKALLLGYGGAGKAVLAVLNDLEIPVKLVSRSSSDNTINYRESENLIGTHQLIINCTPLGTFPKTEECPAINYDLISKGHFLFDLVYNPPETLFLRNGLQKGASVKNGYDMLVYQAEKSWEIWNTI